MQVACRRTRSRTPSRPKACWIEQQVLVLDAGDGDRRRAVAAARPTNDATSMWSGRSRGRSPRGGRRPRSSACWSRCPRCGRPSCTSMRHRSCTCGSQAALTRRVRARRQHGGHDGVLRAGHARLVEEDARAAQAAGRAHGEVAAHGRRSAPSAAERVEVRVDAAAADDVAARRRHVDRPLARQQRPGQQDRGADAGAERRGRARCARCGSARTIELVLPHPRRRRRRRGRRARPSPRRRGCAGRSTRRTSSSVRRQAARMGRAAFLLPSGRTVPGERDAALDDELLGQRPSSRVGGQHARRMLPAALAGSPTYHPAR